VDTKGAQAARCASRSGTTYEAVAVAHGANTYTPTGGQPIESCNVCHASGAAYAVDVVHNITTLYSVHLGYPREP
jgi:hypothetical protein